MAFLRENSRTQMEKRRNIENIAANVMMVSIECHLSQYAHEIHL